MYYETSLSLADNSAEECECKELRGKSLVQALITTDPWWEGRGVVYALDEGKLQQCLYRKWS